MTKQTDEAPTPSLRGLIDKLIDQKLATVQGPMPGKVTSYDVVKQRVSVQPLVERVFYDEVGTRTTQLRPVVQDVPVYFPGGGDTRITTGVKVGDTVLLIPCGVSIARWAVRGGQVDPGEDKGSLSDCVALVGLHDFAHVPTTAPDSAIIFHADDIRLGGVTAFQAAILGNAFESALTTLLAAIATFAATCTTTPAGTPATTLATAITTFSSLWSSMLSTITKLE
jgi:hypothetical protein